MKEGAVYFLADAHLGLNYADPVGRERRFAALLTSIAPAASEVFLLGDIFDFWYEYKNVIPNGFTRTLGALAHLVDSGVKVHFFNGNHDIWTYRYLQNEIGVIMEKQPCVIEIGGKVFCLGHGDGLWDNSKGYKLLQSIFKNRFLQVCFSTLHPRLAFGLGHSWSRHNRLTRYNAEDNSLLQQANCKYQEKVVADCMAWCEEFRQTQGKKIDYFIFGHYHLPVQEQLKGGGELFILGDWIRNADYILFNGTTCQRVRL